MRRDRIGPEWTVDLHGHESADGVGSAWMAADVPWMCHGGSIVVNAVTVRFRWSAGEPHEV